MLEAKRNLNGPLTAHSFEMVPFLLGCEGRESDGQVPALEFLSALVSVPESVPVP